MNSKSTELKKYRLGLHLMPPVGFMNDPVGLCYYKGKYHVFFQYSPEDVDGGLKCWGHYVSENLIEWEFIGTPIMANCAWDKDGAYSGSAFVADGEMEIYYTGNVKYKGDYDYILLGREANVLRVTSIDGFHFGEKECLLTNKDYPSAYTCHVRDPKVINYKDKYYLLLGARRKDDCGAIITFQSDDKDNWSFYKEIATKDKFGYMWECPDKFILKENCIVACCPQGVPSEEFKYQNVDISGYFVANEDLLGIFHEWDMGFDFYAPQTFEDYKGRRILIGWAGMPNSENEYNNEPAKKEGWQHCHTLLRELSWVNSKIYQYPVEEYKKLREERIMFDKNNNIINASMWDAEMMRDNEYKPFCIYFSEDFLLQFNSGKLELKFLNKSGAGRKSRCALCEKVSEIRVIKDTSEVEIYINKGEVVFTTRYYPRETMQTKLIGIENDFNVKIWKMKALNIINGGDLNETV